MSVHEPTPVAGRFAPAAGVAAEAKVIAVNAAAAAIPVIHVFRLIIELLPQSPEGWYVAPLLRMIPTDPNFNKNEKAHKLPIAALFIQR